MLLNSNFVKAIINKIISGIIKKKLDLDGKVDIHRLDIEDANDNYININLEISVVAKKDDVEKLVTRKLQDL